MVLKNTVILIPVKKNFEHLKYKNALKEKKNLFYVIIIFYHLYKIPLYLKKKQ